MSKAIHLWQIDNLQSRPRYVMIAGGIASGKNHVVKEHIHSIKIMDVDDVMERMSYTDYTGVQFHHAMQIIGKEIDMMMGRKECLIAMGTSSNLGNAINRLHYAKMMGYTTILAYIDAPVEQAVSQNTERREKGKRFVTDEEARKIERTNTGAAQTVAALKDTALVDYFAHYLNIR
jgi:predicted kinase